MKKPPPFLSAPKDAPKPKGKEKAAPPAFIKKGKGK